MSYGDFMRAAHRKQAAQQGDHLHDVALNAALAAVNELIDQESAEDEGDQDLAPLRTARQSLLQFQTVEHAENEDGEDTNARLAKMRLILADTKAARASDVNTHGEGSNYSLKPSGSHRDLSGSGQFVAPRVRPVDVLSLKRHLTEDHGLNPGYVGTLIGPSLHAAHDRVHADRGGSDQ